MSTKSSEDNIKKEAILQIDKSPNKQKIEGPPQEMFPQTPEPKQVPQQASQQSSDTPQLASDKIDSLDWDDLTVEIRNLKFTYQKKKGYLLQDINMTFPKSAMYDLTKLCEV